MKRIHILFLLCIAFAQVLRLNSQIIKVGNGSYTTKFPGNDAAGRNAIPSGTPYLKGDVKDKPVPTNDWWSAKVKNPHCDNLFNYPLTLKTTSKGLVTSYIPWGVISDIEPIVSSVKGLNANAAYVNDYSDWLIRMEWDDKQHRIQARVGMGMPFVYYEKDSNDIASITVNTGTTTVSNEMILIENAYNGADFVVYAPTGSTWTQNGKNFESSLNGKNYWSIAMMPETTKSLSDIAKEFQEYAYVEPIRTTSNFVYTSTNSKVTTTFKIESITHEGTDSLPLMGLLPHQWDNTMGSMNYLYEYKSIRGALKMSATHEFKVSYSFKGILPTLPYVDLNSKGFDPQVLNQKIQAIQYDGLATWTDSYNEGQVMNRLIQTARIAHEMGNQKAVETIIKTIKTRLEDWLTVESNEVAFLFHYSKDWSTLIGYPAGHGQDGNINDHHFHWGYFIHAASFLEEFDPGWAKKFGPMINLLVRDAASDNRKDSLFPYLRNFNPYTGHCWANGFASFPQGNDQESTSESMQFNSSLIHWGEVTENTAIRDLGIYLYTTEQAAIEEYWFDTKERNFGPNQNYALVSRVWGNSYDNGTFWTSDIAASYGIELYPIHGGSLYLYHDSAYAEKLWAEMSKNTGILKNEANVNLWHDVYWKFLAFMDAPKAISLYDSYSQRSLKFGISDAQTYHWLHSLNALGKLQPHITSNHPLAVVFRKDKELIYVAKNYGKDTLTVTYSNGYKFKVPPHELRTSIDGDIKGTLNATFLQSYRGGSTTLVLDSLSSTPDKVILYKGSIAVDSSTSSPFVFKQEDLSLGLHHYYAKIFGNGKFSSTNFVSITVGDQIPYGGSASYIPGSIQTGLFDEFEGGVGQGICYQDASVDNLGDFRTTEYADVSKDPNEGSILTWIDAGEWTEYTVEIEKDGIYEVEIRYANGNSSNAGPLHFSLNQQSIGEDIYFPSTGKWESFSSVKTTIPLKKGTRILRLNFEGSGMNLGSMSFTYKNDLSILTPTANAGGNRVQSKDITSITLDGSQSIAGELAYLNYHWKQLYGPNELNMANDKASTLSLSDLIQGKYKFRLTVSDSVYSDYDEVTVLINDGRNIAPTARLVSPTNNGTFIHGKRITLQAVASDNDGKIERVDFWLNGELFSSMNEAPFQVDSILSPGKYEVYAIAYDDSGSSVKTESAQIELISIVGNWKLAPKAGALGVGPSKDNAIWWSNSTQDINTRNCLFDDLYVFESNGTFRNVLGSLTWLEGWQNNGKESCGNPVAPHDGKTSGNWKIDPENGHVIITGAGLFLGLPKATNSGELNASSTVPDSRTYEADITENSLDIGIDYRVGYWNFDFVKATSNSRVNTSSMGEITLYPNPARNYFRLRSMEEIQSVEILDLSGKLLSKVKVNRFKEVQVEIEHLRQGTYMVCVSTATNRKKFLLVK